MPKRKTDPQTRAHLEWLGFVQPQGLVVSTPALNSAGAVLPRNDVEGQALLKDCVDESDDPGTPPTIRDFEEFASSVLGWSLDSKFYDRVRDMPDLPTSLVAHLPDFGETLIPDYAVRHRKQPEGASKWQLLVRTVPAHQEFDKREQGSGTLDATAHGRLERLLRKTEVEAGMLFNGRAIRLVSAPRGETSGWMDFRVSDMLETAGRPIVAAIRLLLGESRLLKGKENTRLPALLRESRKYQNEVSERLAEQVLHALYELVRGIQAAHDKSGGTLLRDVLERDPDEVYRGLLTVILRTVFLLYAEQRDLLPKDEVFVRHYSLGGLYERLRKDAARHPTTMDNRYGAWAQLTVLFRIIHDGARSGAMRLPARKGSLFDPHRFRFLSRAPQAREGSGHRQGIVPLVPDGTVYRVLEKLLLLDGERISYRALDVEQIGSVYETMMGFRIETATGMSLAIKAMKKNGAPSTIDLDALLNVSAEARRKWILDRTDRKITPRVNKAVRSATAIEELHAALEPVVDWGATPDRVPKGALVLQPGRERRASGSHYTPRSLTEPIVRETIDPILQRLRNGGTAAPESVLAVKICDPAMGSGAFLVEACRQLAKELLKAWQTHGGGVDGVGENEAIIAARRTVAQNCLYGVDRNPVAVDLAKMSLWLTTLAQDHPLTFLDHALRHGDSLLGLTKIEIEDFRIGPQRRGSKRMLASVEASKKVDEATTLRRMIQAADLTTPQEELERLWQGASRALDTVRLLGDLLLAAHFKGDGKKKKVEQVRQKYEDVLIGPDGIDSIANPLDRLRSDEKPLASFHWEVEFPEVFERKRPGFDGIVGNPPFAGGGRMTGANRPGYLDYLKAIHSETHGNADLSAHFFRRSFSLLRDGGSLGLIATNTIAQGDTRATGLRWICKNGGWIYSATRRKPWLGDAAVVVSVVHILRRPQDGTDRAAKWMDMLCLLDGEQVDAISAFLVPGTVHDDPHRLRENTQKSFTGSKLTGMGFTFDDTDKKGVASTLARMQALISDNVRNQEVIQPYIGGQELNSSPRHAFHRYVINFRDYPLERDANLKPGYEDVTRRAQELTSNRDIGIAGDRVQSVAGCRELLNILKDLRRMARERKLKQEKPVAVIRELIHTVQHWNTQGRVPRDYPFRVARDWPDLLKIVRTRVRPARAKLKNKELRNVWWRFERTRPALYSTIRGLRRVLAISQVTAHAAFTFLPSGMVYAHRLVLFPFDSYAAYCVLQSRPHEIWTRSFGSSLRNDLTYTPSDCFETFPFPNNWHRRPDFEEAGKEYYDFRASLMKQTRLGLTETYNRFHDRYERDPSIERLRELHDRMDRAVLSAYGWDDLKPGCSFHVDETSSTKRKKTRYRWSNENQEKVLGRLLELNAERKEAEETSG